MSIRLNITEGTTVHEGQVLAVGEHTIGRGPLNAVVLEGRNVSRNHARIVVSEDGTATITDLGSANGTFLNGKKIHLSQPLKGRFQISIGSFLLTGEVVREPEAAARAGELGKWRWTMRTPRFTAAALGGFLGLLVFLLAAGIVRARMEREFQKMTIERAVIYARYLAEMNRLPLSRLDEGTMSSVRVEPVTEEEGVVGAYVVDALGRVRAPLDDLGKVMEGEGLAKVLAGEGVRVEDGDDENTKTVLYPVALGSRVLGVAVLSVGFGDFLKERAGWAGKEIVGLFLAVFGGTLLGWFTGGLFLRPTAALADEVSVALKEGRETLDFSAPYEELSALTQGINRLLMKGRSAIRTEPGPLPVPAPGPLAPDPGPGSPSIPCPPAAARGDLAGLLAILPLPTCTVDPKTHTLKFANEAFRQEFPRAGTGTPEGAHLLEVFEDPEWMGSLSLLVEGAESSAELPTAGGNYRIQCIMVEGNEGEDRAVLVFHRGAGGPGTAPVQDPEGTLP